MLCFATFVLELCVWMEIEYKHGIEGERDNAYDDCWIMYVETIGCWFLLSYCFVE